MPSLKQFRVRINSVKSTMRITSAMKMVAVARLRKSQERALAARPYAIKLQGLLSSVSAGSMGRSLPALLEGRKPDKRRLNVVVMTDRGLCGGLNSNLRKMVLQTNKEDKKNGIESRWLLVGRKSGSLLNPFIDSDSVIARFENFVTPRPDAEHAQVLCAKIVEIFEQGQIDSVQLFYNNFLNALVQTPSIISLIPFVSLIDEQIKDDSNIDYSQNFDFEPGKTAVLEKLVPKILTVQLYRALIEGFASEQAARMTAMDSATRNANTMLEDLSLGYNRLRQASITREIIEIISGTSAI